MSIGGNRFVRPDQYPGKRPGQRCVPVHSSGVRYDLTACPGRSNQGGRGGLGKEGCPPELEQRIYPIYYYKEYYNDLAASYSGGIGGVSSGQSFGIGGSMARFGLYENYLYVTNQYNLKIFDITSLNSPVEKGSQYVGWNIETLFVYNKHLFFGTTTGLLIYSLDLPTAPNKVNQYTHITSCDPVVVADNIAYVTLRGGTTCGGTLNELDVLKLSSDYKTISPLAVFPMTSP
jgi:hypothetical protein